LAFLSVPPILGLENGLEKSCELHVSPDHKGGVMLQFQVGGTWVTAILSREEVAKAAAVFVGPFALRVLAEAGIKRGSECR